MDGLESVPGSEDFGSQVFLVRHKELSSVCISRGNTSHFRLVSQKVTRAPRPPQVLPATCSALRHWHNEVLCSKGAISPLKGEGGERDGPPHTHVEGKSALGVPLAGATGGPQMPRGLGDTTPSFSTTALEMPRRFLKKCRVVSDRRDVRLCSTRSEAWGGG